MGWKEPVTSDRLLAIQFKSKQLSFVDFGGVPIQVTYQRAKQSFDGIKVIVNTLAPNLAATKFN